MLLSSHIGKFWKRSEFCKRERGKVHLLPFGDICEVLVEEKQDVAGRC